MEEMGTEKKAFASCLSLNSVQAYSGKFGSTTVYVEGVVIKPTGLGFMNA